MQYIVKDANDRKMIMTVVSSLPSLPEGFEILGLAEDMPDIMSEINMINDTEKLKSEARKLLSDTDWKVIRHRDQMDAKLPTSLTEEEFTKLLNDRQAARDII